MKAFLKNNDWSVVMGIICQEDLLMADLHCWIWILIHVLIKTANQMVTVQYNVQNFAQYTESVSDSNPNCGVQKWDWKWDRNRNLHL